MNAKRVGILMFVALAVAVYFLNKKAVVLTEQKEMKLESLAGPGYQLVSTLVLNNPNLLSSTIKSIHEKFYINGALVGILDNELNQGIPGLKETEFPVSIRFPEDALKSIPGYSDTTSSFSVRTEGEIIYQNLIAQGKIAIRSTFSVNLVR